MKYELCQLGSTVAVTCPRRISSARQIGIVPNEYKANVLYVLSFTFVYPICALLKLWPFFQFYGANNAMVTRPYSESGC